MDILRIAARVAAKRTPGTGFIVLMSWDEPESGRAVFSVDGLSREELDQVAAWSEAVSGNEWGHALPSIEISEGRAKEVLGVRDFADAIRYTEEGVYTVECPVFKAHGIGLSQYAVNRQGARTAGAQAVPWTKGDWQSDGSLGGWFFVDTGKDVSFKQLDESKSWDDLLKAGVPSSVVKSLQSEGAFEPGDASLWLGDVYGIPETKAPAGSEEGKLVSEDLPPLFRKPGRVLSTVRSASVPVTVDASSHGRLEHDDQPRHPRHSQYGSDPAHEKASYSVSGTVGGVPYSVTGVIRVLGYAIDSDEDEDGHHAELIPYTSDAEFNEDVVFTLAGKVYEGKLWREWPEDVIAASDTLWESKFGDVVEGLTEAVGERFVEELGGDLMDSAADSAALARDPYKYYGVKRSDFY